MTLCRTLLRLALVVGMAGCGTASGPGDATGGGGQAAGRSGASGAAGPGGASGTAGGAAGGGAGGVVGIGGAAGLGGAGGSGVGGSGGATAGSGGATAGSGGATAGSGGATAGSGGRGGGGGGRGGAAGTGGVPSLHEKYATFFPIGAAVDNNSYTTHAAILTKHFNSVTAEDQMKFDALQPTEGSFTYATADRIVSFARTNNMKVRGHALVWHRQTPAWVFSSGSGTASRDVVLTRMRNHISNVVRHFRGNVYAWDVVNEAMMEDGTLRTGDETGDQQQSRWYQIAGESYIAEAFKAAAAADPDAKLFYNDFYNYLPAKSDGIYRMLQGLIAAGVPVHGVGLQAHLNIEPSMVMTHQGYHQTVANMEAAIQKYASLGLEVHVTEMDMSLYIPGRMYTSDMFYTAATFTDALQTQQAERYRAFFDLFRAHRDVITSVTFWGIADDNTWLSEFTSGRKDFPLLFDTNKQPKKAFWAVVDF